VRQARPHTQWRGRIIARIRKEELRFLEWDDIDAGENVIAVTEKKITKDRPYSFKPKMGQERRVTVPQELIARLLGWKQTSPCRLVFPTRNCKPDNKIWDGCQAIAKRAGFTPQTFHVHRFRATFPCEARSLAQALQNRTQQCWISTALDTDRLPARELDVNRAACGRRFLRTGLSRLDSRSRQRNRKQRCRCRNGIAQFCLSDRLT
jgi:integrase